MKCHLCGREKHIAYELTFDICDTLDLNPKELPCLECLVKLAEDRGIALELGSFHFLFPWIDEDHGVVHAEVENLLRRMSGYGPWEAMVAGVLPYSSYISLRWEFRGHLQEERPSEGGCAESQ